jgi:hypothetical protein
MEDNEIDYEKYHIGKKNYCNCLMICSVKNQDECIYYSAGKNYDDEKQLYECVWHDKSSWCFNTAANYLCLTRYLHQIYTQLEKRIQDQEISLSVAMSKLIKVYNNVKYPLERNQDE